MKIQRHVLVLVFLFSLNASASPLILNNAPISDLASWVSSQTGEVITFSDSQDLPININIPDSTVVDPWALFESTLSNVGLNISKVDSIYIVSSNAVHSEEQEPFIYPLETYYFNVLPVNLEDIYSASLTLLNVFYERESLEMARSVPRFTVNKSINESSLVFNLPSKYKDDLTLFINSLNVKPQQLLIEAVIFETTDLEFDAIGVDLTNISLNGLSVDFGITAGALSASAKGGALSYSKEGNVKSVIRALDTSDKTTILSTPELRVMDRGTGRVQVGQQVPFITSTVVNDSGLITNNVVRETVGLNFIVKPTIQSGNTIRIEFSTSVGSLTGDSTAADVITTNRSLDTTINAFDGELIYLGGLITDEMKNSIITVPGLSHLPILGGLFASKENKQNRTKLSVFLKCSILKDH